MFQKFALVLSSAAVLASALFIFSDAPASAKAKHRSHRTTIASSSRGSYFVPPPPPYSPSVLPEMRAGRVGVASVQEAVPVKPVNPYRKYVYTPKEENMPTPVQPNKYVSYWHHT